MRLWLLIAVSSDVEPFAQLIVFLIGQLVRECQVIRSCKIKNRAADVRLALPHATHDAGNRVYLQKFVHLELGKLVKDSDSLNVLLLQHFFDPFGCLKMLKDHNKVLLESLTEQVNSES